MSPDAVGRPPAVEGIPTAGPADAARILDWSQRGHRHGITHNEPWGRVVSLMMWVATAVLRPLMVIHYRRMLTRLDACFYKSPDGDCVLVVVATAGGWSMVDHIAAHPGRGTGRPLRRTVLGALAGAADAAGVAISTTAVNQKMADTYIVDLPGPGRHRLGVPARAQAAPKTSEHRARERPLTRNVRGALYRPLTTSPLPPRSVGC